MSFVGVLRCSLFVVCCMLLSVVVCCLLVCLSIVVRGLSFVVRHFGLLVVGCLLCVVCL